MLSADGAGELPTRIDRAFSGGRHASAVPAGFWLAGGSLLLSNGGPATTGAVTIGTITDQAIGDDGPFGGSLYQRTVVTRGGSVVQDLIEPTCDSGRCLSGR